MLHLFYKANVFASIVLYFNMSGFVCPITHSTMVDPVQTCDGMTYERVAIERWFQTHNTSPLTGVVLANKRLTTNFALRDAIASSAAATPEPVNIVEQTHEDLRFRWHQQGGVSMLTCTVPEAPVETPLDLVVGVDVSGSMCTYAVQEGENLGLTLMDIQCHALRAVIAALGPRDRLAIVAYSTEARVRLPLVAMDTQGKARASVVVAGLLPDGSTNLWDGLKKCLGTLQDKPTRLASVMLFTDGLPNIKPPRGELAMLKRELDKRTALPVNLHTFGIGYKLDSPLLASLADVTRGSYSFIPDSGFVGTIVVHALANLKMCAAQCLELSLESEQPGDLSVHGGYMTEMASWGTLTPLGLLQRGQTRHIIVDGPVNSATLRFRRPTGQVVTVEAKRQDMAVDAQQVGRSTVVDILRECFRLCQLGRFEEANTYLTTAVFGICEPYQEELNDQVLKAIEPGAFAKWGRHYLPSLWGAHQQERCNNFKDVAVQHYGGEQFKKTRDQIDDLFNALPPPKPSATSALTRQCGAAAPAPTRQYMIQSFNSAVGPCFDGSCVVRLEDDSVKRLDELRKGDRVRTSNGYQAIACIVRTSCVDGYADLVELDNGLKVTPWHPIRKDGQWCFPSSLAKSDRLPCTHVYSFLLENHCAEMWINGWECIALAHGILDDPVATHAYYGTTAIVADLMTMDGYDDGLVDLQGGQCVQRDIATGLVCGLVQ